MYALNLKHGGISSVTCKHATLFCYINNNKYNTSASFMLHTNNLKLLYTYVCLCALCHVRISVLFWMILYFGSLYTFSLYTLNRCHEQQTDQTTDRVSRSCFSLFDYNCCCCVIVSFKTRCYCCWAVRRCCGSLSRFEFSYKYCTVLHILCI